jgi:hypothetical protein
MQRVDWGYCLNLEKIALRNPIVETIKPKPA